MISKDREYRSFDFTLKPDEMVVEGQPILFETPTVLFSFDGMDFNEVIDRKALDEAKMNDVVLVVNHSGTPAARTKNGTLQLTKTDSGLFMRADVSKSSVGPALHQDIENGVFDKMSFAFTIREQSYDAKTRTNRILKIDRLFDVSAVTFPAYEETSINARSFFEAEAKKEMIAKAEAEAREQKMLKLKGLLNKEVK